MQNEVNRVGNITFRTDDIRQWACDRGLHGGEPARQLLKLVEEVGELAQGVVKNRPEAIRDGIGDVFVVLTVLSLQLGVQIEDCIELAYQEIKDRRGMMVNGVFVKAEDLP